MEESVFASPLTLLCLARTAFKDRLSSVRDLLSPAGGPKLDNLGLMSALLDLAEFSRTSSSAGAHSSVGPGGSFLPYSDKTQ